MQWLYKHWHYHSFSTHFPFSSGSSTMYSKSLNLSISSCVLTRTLLDLFVLPLAMDLFVSTSRHSNMLTCVHSPQSNYDPCLVMSPRYLPLVLVPRRINVCVLISSMSSVPHQHTHTTGGLWLFRVSTSYLLYCILCHVFIYIVCHYINQCISKAAKEQKTCKKWRKKNKKKIQKL